MLKTVHKNDCSMSQKAMSIMDSFANDLFERIADEAVKLLRLTGKKTLTAREIQTAAKLVLPGELGAHAIQDGRVSFNLYPVGFVLNRFVGVGYVTAGRSSSSSGG